MALSQSLNNIYIYGDKALLKGKVAKVKTLLGQIIQDHQLVLNSIEINIISDQDLLEINRTSLKHDYYTDIITFDYSNNKTITGDIYISIDRIKENAAEYQTSSFNELLRVMCHGVLHLSGYKDKTKIDKLKMTEMENVYLLRYGKSSTGNIM